MPNKLKFTDPQALADQINRYFEMLRPDPANPKDEGRPPTMSGLALFLGTTRRTLLEYINEIEKPGAKAGGKNRECAELIVMAKAQIECWMEERLVTDYSRGLEFVLQNGYYGWGEKKTTAVQGTVEVEHKGEVGTPVSRMSDEELIEQLKILGARQAEIMKREGIGDGADG